MVEALTLRDMFDLCSKNLEWKLQKHRARFNNDLTNTNWQLSQDSYRDFHEQTGRVVGAQHFPGFRAFGETTAATGPQDL